jgi:hypothetical protein
MKYFTLSRLALLAAGAALTASATLAITPHDIAQIRRATAQFHRMPVAFEAGYDWADWDETLTGCVQHPVFGAMGYHLFNKELILNPDNWLDPLRPQALVYAPGPAGNLHLAAVEYIVRQEEWHAIHGHDVMPSLLGVHLHPAPRPDLGWYILHIWVWRHNPAGILEDWNPAITCP